MTRKNEDRNTDDNGNNVQLGGTTVKLESLDDALSVVGDFGKYQYFLLLGLLPYIFGYAALYFSQFFFTLTPNEHWCKVDELIQRNFTVSER